MKNIGTFTKILSILAYFCFFLSLFFILKPALNNENVNYWYIFGVVGLFYLILKLVHKTLMDIHRACNLTAPLTEKFKYKYTFNLEPIEKLIPIEEFMKGCEDELYTDNDGYGFLYKNGECFRKYIVRPSFFMIDDDIKKEFTHVDWHKWRD